jgi:O-glycosyl hydrolase
VDKIRAKGIPIMSHETAGFDPKYTDIIFNDPDAMSKINIIIGHLYQGFMNTEESSYVKNKYDYIVNMYNKTLAPTGKGGWWMAVLTF